MSKRERPLILAPGAHLLHESIRASYEPTKSEVNEYAEWLGMNPSQDITFLPIAAEGLRAPMPEGWKSCQSAEGEVFYFNTLTGVSTWDHPVDALYRDKYNKAKSLIEPIVPELTIEEKFEGLRHACSEKDKEIEELRETIAGLIDTLRVSQAEVLNLSGEDSLVRRELCEIKDLLRLALGKQRE